MGSFRIAQNLYLLSHWPKRENRGTAEKSADVCTRGPSSTGSTTGRPRLQRSALSGARPPRPPGLRPGAGHPGALTLATLAARHRQAAQDAHRDPLVQRRASGKETGQAKAEAPAGAPAADRDRSGQKAQRRGVPGVGLVARLRLRRPLQVHVYVNVVKGAHQPAPFGALDQSQFHQ